MPSLQQLEALVAIEQSGSFAQAASRLSVSQSAISMQIRALEADLGVTLFDRTVRPPAPTAIAAAILPLAHDVVGRVNEIQRTTSVVHRAAGSLRVGAVPTSAVTLVPEALTRTLRRHPGLVVTVETGLSESLTERVRLKELDAAVVTEPTAVSDELRHDTITRERLVLIGAKGDPVPRVDDVLARPYIRFQRRQGVGSLAEKLLRTRGLEPAEHLELDSIEAVVALVARGLGIAIVPELGIGPDVRASIVARPLEGDEAQRTVSLLYRVDAPRDRLLQLIVEDLRHAGYRR